MKKDISIMIDDVKFNFRVGAIMEYNEKVMIEKTTKVDFGVIPGGRVMTGEDTKEALIREIQEEMHYDISKKEITLQHIIENFFTLNGIKYHELYFVYRVQLDDSDEIVHRKKEELINYDSDCEWYECIDINEIDNEKIQPEALKNIVKESTFGKTIVRD